MSLYSSRFHLDDLEISLSQPGARGRPNQAEVVGA